MNKKQLHHYLAMVRHVHWAYLLALLVISMTVCGVSLRSNNLTMVQLRDEVYAADENDSDVEGALQRLRSYVHGHMNTNLVTEGSNVYPPIQLKYTYQRLKAAESQRVEQANSQVYTDAQAYCEKLYPGSFSGGPRIPCIEQYVTERGVKAKNIPDALYKFDFTSPTWSPDTAGFSMLASVLLGLALILRVGLELVLKRLSK
jgi:hypothetical protein